jgi:hypothetical protein
MEDRKRNRAMVASKFLVARKFSNVCPISLCGDEIEGAKS